MVLSGLVLIREKNPAIDNWGARRREYNSLVRQKEIAESNME